MKILRRTAYVQADHFVSSNGTDPQNMFNDTISQTTTREGDLVVVLEPGNADAIGFAGLVGAHLDVVATFDGDEVFSSTQPLTREGIDNVIQDWFQYFFTGFTQITDAIVTGIPPIGGSQITVTIRGASTACGVCAFGRLFSEGDTQYGASVDIVDYSTKETDEFGVTTFVEGPFSRRLSATVMLDNNKISRLLQVAREVRATPTFWTFADGSDFSEVFLVFGFFRGFSVAVPYPKQSLCSVEIEGLT